MTFTYKYARPAVTVDCAVFGVDGGHLKVLLIQRDAEPFRGKWALPGGFVDVGESLEDAAQRELWEETGLKQVPLSQLHAFSDPDRDPREHVITVAFCAMVDIRACKVDASSDARDAAWFNADSPPELAFDHDRILAMALEAAKSRN